MDEIQYQGKNLRILSVADWLVRGGGAEQQLANMLPKLRSLGLSIDVIVLFAWPDSLAPALRAQGFSVRELGLSPKDLSSMGSALNAVRRALREGDYQVVWSQLAFSNLLCAMLAYGRRKVVHVATFRSEGYGRRTGIPLKNRAFAWLEGFFLARSTRVAVSRPVADDWQRYFGWSSFHVINNGVDIELGAMTPGETGKTEIRTRYGVAPGQKLLVTPARFLPVKGHIYLIEALSILKRTHDFRPKVLAFGFGDKADLLEDARRRDVAFETYPPLPQPDLVRVMQSADAVVMPSLFESFGNVATEAMLLGVPVVLTRTDGFSEIVGDSGCALMAPVADAAALAEAIWATLDDPEAAGKRAAIAKTRASTMFTLDVAAKRWETLFRHVARDEGAKGK